MVSSQNMENQMDDLIPYFIVQVKGGGCITFAPRLKVPTAVAERSKLPGLPVAQLFSLKFSVRDYIIRVSAVVFLKCFSRPVKSQEHGFSTAG